MTKQFNGKYKSECPATTIKKFSSVIDPNPAWSQWPQSFRSTTHCLSRTATESSSRSTNYQPGTSNWAGK